MIHRSGQTPFRQPDTPEPWRSDHDRSYTTTWGTTPDRLTSGQRRDLMEIVEDRYGAGSTLITSQLPVESWHEVIGEPTFADAILDRLVHNAYRLNLKGPSMRKPEPDEMAAAGDTGDAGPVTKTGKGGRK